MVNNMENKYNRDLVVTNKDNVNLQDTENNYDRELLMKSLSSPKKEYRSIPFSQSTPDMPYQKVLFEDNPNQFVSPANIDAIKEGVARNQSMWDMAGSAINQAIIGEIIGGTIAGVGAIPKIIDRFKGTEDAFEMNMLEQFGQDIQDFAKEATPIYQTKEARENVAFGDATFWFNLVPSTASTLSMMLPAMGVRGLVSTLVKGTRAAAITAGIGRTGKLFRASEGLTAWGLVNKIDVARDAAKMFNLPNKAVNILVPAIVSRNLDSSREALGRYEEIYNEYKETFKDLPDGEKLAKKIASEAAHNGYVKSHYNLVFDIIEWTLLGKVGKVANANMDNIAKALLKKGVPNVVLEGSVKSGLKDIGKKVIDSKVTALLATGLSEGFDETSMDYFMNEGLRQAKIDLGYKQDDNTSAFQRYIEHHEFSTKNKTWESFIGGFLGGVSMSAIFAGGSKIHNKYFNKDYNERVANLADDFIKDATTTDETLSRLTDAIKNNKVYEANAIKTELISKLGTASAANGTLMLQIERLENIGNLDINDKDAVAFLKEMEVEDFKSFQKNNLELAKNLREYDKIYTKELGKIRTGKDIDGQLNLAIADIKTKIALNENFKKELIKEYGVEPTEEILDSILEEKIKNLGENALNYYNESKRFKSKKDTNENKISAIDSQLEFHNLQLEILNDSLEKAKSKIDNPEVTLKKRELAKSQIKTLESKIKTANSIINHSKKEQERLTKEIEEAAIELNNATETYSDLSTYKEQVDKELEVKESNLQYAGKMSVKALDHQNKILKDYIAYLETPEGQANFKEVRDANIEESNLEIISDFEEVISKLNTEDEIREELSKMEKNNKYDSSVRKQLIKVYDKRIAKIKSDAKLDETLDTRNDSVVGEGVTVENEVVVTEPNESLTSPSLPANEEIPEVAVSNNGSNFKVGNYVYIIENGKALYDVPFRIKKIDEDKVTVIVQGKNVTKDVSSIFHNYHGESIQNRLANKNKIITKLLEHSKSIIKANRTYTFKGKTQSSTASTLSKKGTMYGTIQGLDTGTRIDNLFKDFFTGNLKSKENYGISSDEAYSNFVTYVSNLKKQLDVQGYTILTINPDAVDSKDNEIKLFDEDSNVAGSIDLIAVNESGDVLILDLKSMKEDIFSDKELRKLIPSIKSYIEQVNIYAYLFEKIIGIPVSKVGIIPIQKTYSKKGIITDLQPVIITDYVLESLTELNDGYIVSKEQDILILETNKNLLNVESSVEGKTIAEVLGIKIPNMSENKDAVANLFKDIKSKLTEGIKDETDTISQELLDRIFSIFKYNTKTKEVTISEKSYYKQVLGGSESFEEYIKYFLNDVNLDFVINKYGTDFTNDLYALINSLNSISYLYNSKLLSPVNPTYYENIPEILQNRASNIRALLLNIQVARSKASLENILSTKGIYIRLIAELKQYMSLETVSTASNLSFKDIIRIIKLSTYDSSEFQHSDLVNILEDMYYDLQSLKKEVWRKGEALIKEELETIDLDKYNIVSLEDYENKDNQIILDKKTGRLYVIKNDKEVDLDWLSENKSGEFGKKSLYQLYRSIDSSINVPSKISNLREYISNSIDSLENENIYTEEHFIVEVNEAINVLTKGNVISKEDNIFETLFKLNKGTKVTLRINESGDIIVTYNENGVNIPIGTISNISTHNKGVKVVDKNGNFTGLDTNIGRDLLYKLSTLVDNKTILDTMYEYHKNKILHKSKNSTTNTSSTANKAKLDFINKLNKDKNSKEFEIIRDIIDKFKTNNLSEKEVVDYVNNKNKVYEVKDIDNITDVLFLGVYINNIDNYKPTLEDVSFKLGYFNILAKSNFIKFESIKNTFPSDVNSMETTINDIIKPSILYKKKNVPRKDLKEVISRNRGSVETTDEPITILNKRSNSVLFNNGASAHTKININTVQNKKEGFYVLIQNVDGSYSPVPLHSNTLGESYTKVSLSNKNHNEETLDNFKNHTNKAVKYVGDTILNILLSNSDTTVTESIDDLENLVKEKVRDIREVTTNPKEQHNDRVKYLEDKINKLIYKSKLRNIIIFKGYNKEIEGSYPYFTHSVGLKNNMIENYIMFTTFDKEGSTETGYKNIQTYHKIVVKDLGNAGNSKPSIIHYTVKSNDKDFIKKIEKLKRESSDNEATIYEINEESISKFSKVLSSVVPNLLRQTKYNNKSYAAEFGSSEGEVVDSTFEDPITGNKYTDAFEYYLDSGSLISDLDAAYVKSDDDVNVPVSNINPFGDSSFKFSIDVPGTIPDANVEIANPLDAIIKTYEDINSPYVDVLKTVREIDDFIANNVDNPADVVHYGKRLLDKNDSTIANIRPIRRNGVLSFRIGYTKRINQNIESSVNNAAFSILHEHVHRTIMNFADNSKLSPEQKLKLIKENNKLTREFITAFEKDFNAYIYLNSEKKIYNYSNIDKLSEGFSKKDRADLPSLIEAYIKEVKNDLEKREKAVLELKEVNNETITSSLLAQEMYTYVTNPYVLHILSNLNNTSMTYESKTNGNKFSKFIEDLINKIIKIYNSVVSSITNSSTFAVKDENYTKIVKDIFSDVIYNFTENAENSLTDDTEVIQVIEQEVETEDTNTDDDYNLEEMSLDDLNSNLLVDSKINSIFVQSIIQNIDTSIKDDENIPLC